MNRQLYMFGFLLLVAGGFLIVRGIDFPGFTLFIIGLFSAIFGFAVPEDETKTAFKAIASSTLTIGLLYVAAIIHVLTLPKGSHVEIQPAIIPTGVIFIILTCVYYTIFHYAKKRKKVQ
ncbi:MAG: hypothetical protein ACP5JW_04050 [Candidatus Bathyarchaeia archaeon]